MALDLLTTKDLAEAIGASESSLRRWTDSGVIKTTRTPGGHRRIPRAEAIRFIRETRSALVRPEILGLPKALEATAEAQAVSSMDSQLRQMLLSGDAAGARSLLVHSYLEGTSIAGLCDGPLRAALHHVGELWRHDSAGGIMAEHRVLVMAVVLVSQLRELLSEPPADALVAVGGAPPDDGYVLPALMASATLAESGWRDVNLGAATPLTVLAAAANKYEARLVWLSVSHAPNRRELERELKQLVETLKPTGSTLLIGGRAADALDLPRSPRVRRLGSMMELAQHAAKLAAARQAK